MIQHVKRHIRAARRKIRNLFGNEYYKSTPWTDAEFQRILNAAHEVGGSYTYKNIELNRLPYDEEHGYPLHIYNVSDELMQDILKKSGIERGKHR